VVLVWLLVQHKKNNSAETHIHTEKHFYKHPVTQKAFAHNERIFTSGKSEAELLEDDGCFSHSSKKSLFKSNIHTKSEMNMA